MCLLAISNLLMYREFFTVQIVKFNMLVNEDRIAFDKSFKH